MYIWAVFLKVYLSCQIHCSLYSSALVYFGESQRVCILCKPCFELAMIMGNQRYLQDLECPWYWSLTWYPWDLYPWGPLCHPHIQLLPVLVMVVSSVQSSGLYMAIDSNTGCLAEMHHGYTIICLGFDFLTKCHHLVELWENFLWLCHLWRTDLCLMETCGSDSYGAVLVKEVLLPCRLHCYLVSWSVIDEGHLVSKGLSSSKLLNTKWWHTGLWNLNFWGECMWCCSAVVSGVLGLKDKFSLIDTRYIHGALLRGIVNV